jgi:hypothetical protein
MMLSANEAHGAEAEARNQCMRLAQLLRSDESKAPTSADVMCIRRIMAAATKRSVTYDQMISEYGVQKLFDCGALYFSRPGV